MSETLFNECGLSSVRVDAIKLEVSSRPKSGTPIKGKVMVGWEQGAVRPPTEVDLADDASTPVIAVIPAKMTLAVTFLLDDNVFAEASISLGTLFRQHSGIPATDERVAQEGMTLARLVLPLANRELKTMLFRADLPQVKLPGDFIQTPIPSDLAAPKTEPARKKLTKKRR
jgi:hypothetical protein